MHLLALRSLLPVGLFCALLSVLPAPLSAQNQGSDAFGIVQGQVHNSQGQAMTGAAVFLESVDSAYSTSAFTNSQGRFQFEKVPAGTYTLRVVLGENRGKEQPFCLRPGETKSIELRVTKEQPLPPKKDSAAAIDFSDEPQFTVAGVTDTTALGGHGSDRVVRNSEAMSKETASLARESAGQPAAAATDAAEATLRAALAQQETAAVHFQLAEIEESRGRSLEAVKDYQRAAELQPSEPHFFAWGAELLLHRAYEPATEVFTKGRRLHPHSVRMILGLGATLYAQGLRDEAGKIFLEASDLDPADPAPYLFLGRLQAAEATVPPAWVDRMKRFAELHPESATAHCLYATALAKQGGEMQSPESIEAQLIIAIALDPNLGAAYLQLGILHAQRKDYPGAIAAFQKAIETTPLPDEAYYRLADVYRRTGQAEKASEETLLFKEISAQKKQEADRERHEIQQFVYTLRGQNTPAQPPASIPPR